MFDFGDLDDAFENEQLAADPSVTACDEVDKALRDQYLAASKALKGDELINWCQKYKPSCGFAVNDPKFRIFTFHNAGSAESCFTGPPPNPITTWVKGMGCVELLALSYPGRDRMVHRPKVESIADLVAAMIPALLPKINDGVPYVLWGHSLGTWVVFEMLLALRSAGFFMPKAVFVAAFTAPQIPDGERPWKPNRHMNDKEFMEEASAWDQAHFKGKAKMIFSDDDGCWPLYGPIMRADFCLFDEYRFGRDGERAFDLPIHAFWMEKDARITRTMVENWKRWSPEAFTLTEVSGVSHLLSLYDAKQQEQYFSAVRDQMVQYV